MENNEVQRVVLLRKNLGEDYSKEIPSLPRSTTKWIALGHFDEIYTYNLPLDESRFFLYSIKQDKKRISQYNDDCVYYHPLYLVGKKLPLVRQDDINENELRFIAIVRIHFAATRNQKQDYTMLCNSIKDACTISYCSSYHATEFSDMVLDLRSQDFHALQQFVLTTLRNNPLIGKMYTYFGINSCFLHSDEFCDQSDIINMLSVRFPCSADPDQIKSIKRILSETSKIEDSGNMFSVNGIDDTLISCSELPTNSLLKAYRSINTPENVKSTTRVGFYIDEPLSKPKVTDISNLCTNLINLRKKMQNKLEQRYVIPRSWFHMIYESVNTLVRMSNTSVMDEIVYLLVPSIEAFMENIIASDISKINRNVKLYNEFAENYVVLIEQLMRSEGQLSQNPEYRPVICDIPVFILEYTLAFLGKITKLLQRGDEGNLIFEFLMMPCACPEIAVRELFPADKNHKGLIQLTIPDHELYRPELVLRPLCHEIAHNVGDKFRCRDTRKKYYCRAAATLVITQLLGTRNDKEAVDKLSERFETKLSSYSHPTIFQMSKILQNDVLSLTHKMQGKDRVADMSNFVGWYLKKVTEPRAIKFLDRYYLDNILKELFARWNDIDTLFREIYADICLLKILELPAEEYVSSLLNIDWRRQKRSIAYEAYAVRIYVTLQVMGLNIPHIEFTKEWGLISELINKIHTEIQNGYDGKNKLSFSINTIVDMIDYGNKCKSVMDECLKDAKGDIIKVQKMYQSFAYLKDYPGYDYIIDAIDTYRQGVIGTS